MKALVTRPVEDARELADALAARGIEPVIEPLLAVRFAADGAALVAPLLDGAQAVLFTSANGVRAFAAASARRDLAAFAVGGTTAKAARDAGFATVASAGGAVMDLAGLVEHQLQPEGGALVHAAASEVAGDLTGALREAGFEVRRALVYETLPAERLSEETTQLLIANDVALALFLSPRTAGTFVALVEKAGLGHACGDITALAFSPAVAAALSPLAFRAIEVAASPTLTALLEAVDRAQAAAAAGPPVIEARAIPHPDPPALAAAETPAEPAPRARRETSGDIPLQAGEAGRGSGVARWLVTALVFALTIVSTAPYWAPQVQAILPWGAAAQSGPDTAALEARIAAAEAARKSAEERIVRLETQAKVPPPTPPAAPDNAAALQALRDQASAQTSAQTSAQAAELRALGDALQKATTRLDDLQAQLGRVAARSDAADTSDLRLFAAVADLRAALAGSGPYETELATAETLGRSDPTIADTLKPLAADAKTGLPSASLLAARYRGEIAPELRRVPSIAPAATDDGSLGARMLAKLRGLVSIRRIGDEAPPSSAAPATRSADEAFAAGDLAAAVAALAKLPGVADEPARSFLAVTQRRLQAEQAVAAAAHIVADRLAQSAGRGEQR